MQFSAKLPHLVDTSVLCVIHEPTGLVQMTVQPLDLINWRRSGTVLSVLWMIQVFLTELEQNPLKLFSAMGPFI